MRRFVSLGAAGWLLVSVPAEARFALAPGFPLTASGTGTETATALAVDLGNRVWLAGNVTHTATGRDVLVRVYEFSATGFSVSATEFDRSGGDEGTPAMVVDQRTFGGGSPPIEPEAWLAFSTSATGSRDATVWRLRGVFVTSHAREAHEDLGGLGEHPRAIAVSSSGTPFVAGSVVAGGVGHLLYYRRPQARNPSKNWDPKPRVTATFWSGSTTSIEGVAVAVEGSGYAWIAARVGEDLQVFRYTDGWLLGASAADRRADLVPGYPVSASLITPARDFPEAMARDAAGRLWIVGATDGRAAIWRHVPGVVATGGGAPDQWWHATLDSTAPGAAWAWDRLGDAIPPPPPLAGAVSSTLYAVTVDAAGRVFAVGEAEGDLLVLGLDSWGRLLPGFPLTESGAPDRTTGRGVDVSADGALWVAATATAAGSSSWSGTVGKLYRFLEPGAAPALAPGVVRFPEGTVLEGVKVLADGTVFDRSAVPIVVRPATADWIEARILTMRGEPVRVLRAFGEPSGETILSWDGRNVSGDPVAVGTYILLVHGGGLRVLRRVVVLR